MRGKGTVGTCESERGQDMDIELPQDSPRKSLVPLRVQERTIHRDMFGGRHTQRVGLEQLQRRG